MGRKSKTPKADTPANPLDAALGEFAAPVATEIPGTANELPRVVVQARIHDADFTASIVEDPPKDPARAKAAKLLLAVARGEDEFQYASITTRLDAIDSLLVNWDESFAAELRGILESLTEPPSDIRDRVRAAKLLLSL